MCPEFDGDLSFAAHEAKDLRGLEIGALAPHDIEWNGMLPPIVLDAPIRSNVAHLLSPKVRRAVESRVDTSFCDEFGSPSMLNDAAFAQNDDLFHAVHRGNTVRDNERRATAHQI